MPPTIDELIEYALSWKSPEKVTELRIGLAYTAVKLASGQCGLACMLRHRIVQTSCSLPVQAGSLLGTEVSHLIPLLHAQNVVEASVGLAVINALASQESFSSTHKDIFEIIQVRQTDRIGIVGYIGPIVKEARRQAKEIFVFDEAKPDLHTLSAVDRERELLACCDVVILSATSLLNHTFGSLLDASIHAREICLIGPSTPLLPEFFSNKGLTLLAGREITNVEKLLQIVSEGGGTKHFKNVTRKVNLVLKKP